MSGTQSGTQNGAAQGGAGARKERVLHTRISDQLAEDIRALAEDLRVPVSNLVRNVLEEAFSAAERVTGDVGEIVEEVVAEAERAAERLHRFREGQGDREERIRRRLEQASQQVGHAAERFADAVDRMAQRARERAERRAAAEAAQATPPPSPRPDPSEVGGVDLSEVAAWQPVVLNRPQRCAVTGRLMAAGERAFLGIGARGLTDLFVSEGALPALASP